MLSDEERKVIDKINNSYDYNTRWVEADASDWKIVTDLIEKQSKEIEELKEKNKTQSDCAEPIERTEEMVNMRWVNHNYILKTESEQKERKAYIKGTNDADELCNKKWKDKIKAKIEEVQQRRKNDGGCELALHGFQREAKIEVLESLLKKE